MAEDPSGVSIGIVIDHFVEQLPAALGAIDPTALVCDNWPEEEAQGYVVIGHTSPESGVGADGEQMYLTLGGGRVEEHYSIPCYIEVTRPGPSQKPSRDAAINLLNGVVLFVASDPTLATLLVRGRYALLSKLQLIQTQDAADTGESGLLRRTVIPFEIAVQNTYVPR